MQVVASSLSYYWFHVLLLRIPHFDLNSQKKADSHSSSLLSNKILDVLHLHKVQDQDPKVFYHVSNSLDASTSSWKEKT
jgi:hypothetical protein